MADNYQTLSEFNRISTQMLLESCISVALSKLYLRGETPSFWQLLLEMGAEIEGDVGSHCGLRLQEPKSEVQDTTEFRRGIR